VKGARELEVSTNHFPHGINWINWLDILAGRRVGIERRPNFRLLPVLREASTAWRCGHARGAVQWRQKPVCES
jgi:hypothetical protein